MKSLVVAFELLSLALSLSVPADHQSPLIAEPRPIEGKHDRPSTIGQNCLDNNQPCPDPMTCFLVTIRLSWSYL